MSKTQNECASKGETTRAGPPPLNAGVRRHLGHSLRTFYADILSDPPGARIEALLARLGTSKR